MKKTLQDKIDKEVPSQKLSPEMKEFVGQIDHLRTIASKTSASFSLTLLAMREGK